MLTAQQVEIRKTGIGASEIAGVIELDPYRSPIDVWLDKTGRAAPREEADDDSAIAVGNELEGALVAMLGRRVHLDFAQPHATFRHPRYPHMLASPDALARGKRGGEIKVVGWRMAHHWEGDAVPDYVRLQALQNMAVMGAEAWHVGALLGGNTFRVHTIERDRELEEMLADTCESFWTSHVANDVPPPVADPEERRRYLRTRYPGSTATTCRRVSDPVVVAAVDRLRELKEEARAIEREEGELQGALCELIANDYGIEGSFGKALWYPTKGAPRWREIAEALAGGSVPDALIEEHRNDPGRTFRLYDAKPLLRKTRTR